MAQHQRINYAIVKHLLLGLLVLILVLPGIQARTQLLPEKPLVGAYTPADHPDFTWAGFLDNSYAPALERYVEDRIGFRSLLIRLRNQLSFSLFQVARSSDIVVGQHEVLFQPSPIRSYRGKDLMEPREVRFQVRQLRIVQRDFAQRGITLLYALAPNKARLQPEYLPAYLQPSAGSLTNYDQFAQQLTADSVDYLDFVSLFARWKKTKPYPLFPQAGTHWSCYGASLAADTLLRRLEAMGHFRLRTVREVGPPQLVANTDSLHGTDNDIGWSMNLLWVKPTDPPLAYRHLVFDPLQPGQVRPSLLLVGDSFGWALMQVAPYIQREFAADSRYLYYNKTVYIPDTVAHPTGQKVSDLDLKQNIESRKVIVLLLTEHNLTENNFFFISSVYHLYHPYTGADWAAIDRLAQEMVSKATWDEAAAEGAQFKQTMYDRAQREYERQLLEKH